MQKLTKKTQALFDALMKLCSENECFYFIDQKTVMQTKVRIFNYRMANYTEWLKPGALECRGIMFAMEDDKAVKLISRPMEKFFNYAEVKAWEALKESPVTIGDVVIDVMIKEDGSLVSTFCDSGYLGVKSKASVQSEQAMDAMSVIQSERELFDRLTELTRDGFTTNMEYVAPNNRIVIGYQQPAVVILNIRNNETGEYVDYQDIFADGALRPFLVQREKIEITDLDAFIKDAYTKEGFEGFVIKTDKGYVKAKTNWYVNLHRTKDSITNNKDLFLNIVENTVDDLKQMFSSDIYSLKKIDAFETMFLNSVNRLSAKAMQAIEDTKGKSRKDYAITLSADLTPDGRIIFGPMMRYFDDTDKQKLIDNIVAIMAKNHEQFIPEEYK